MTPDSRYYSDIKKKCLTRNFTSQALLINRDDGTFDIMELIPSSRNQATPQWGVVFDFSSPIYERKKKGYQKESFLFYGKGNIS